MMEAERRERTEDDRGVQCMLGIKWRCGGDVALSERIREAEIFKSGKKGS